VDGDHVTKIIRLFDIIRNDLFVDFFDLVSSNLKLDIPASKKLMGTLSKICYIEWRTLLELAQFANEDSLKMAKIFQSETDQAKTDKAKLVMVLKDHILKEIGDDITGLSGIDDASQKLCLNIIDLLILMEVSNPRMKFIDAKNGEYFNPEKHQSVDTHQDIYLTGMKEPGIISTFDNTVITKATVYTEIR